jgi:hypothetical protein
MLVEPTRTQDVRSNGAFRIETWRLDAGECGEAIELPITLAASVQVIGSGEVVIEAGIDRRNLVPIGQFKGLQPLDVAVRYLRPRCLSGSAMVHMLMVSER